MAPYIAILRFDDKQSYFPGDILSGEIIYTSQKRYLLRGAELQLRCKTKFWPSGARKPYALEEKKEAVKIRHSNGTRVSISESENIGGGNGTNIFIFKITLPNDLLPSTISDVLEVSYLLILTSKRGFFRRVKTDTSHSVQVRPFLNLAKDLFLQMARKGIHAKDECIGLGFGILYSAWLPKYCWEIGEHVEICLNITRLSDISIQSQVFLERTIVFMTEAGKYVSRADRIAQSGVKTLEWTMIEGDCGSADVSFSLEIPERNLVTGVLGCRKISIHYKIVVEIKACGSCLPTRTLCLPILVGINPNRSLRQRSAQSFPRRLPSHPMGASDDESLQQTALALPPGEGIHLNVQNPSCITTERSPSLSRISFASPYGGVTYNSGPRVLGAQRPSAVHYNQGRAAPEAKNLNAADDVTAIDRANCAAQNRIYETLGDTASSGCGFQTQWERNESLQPAIRISGYQDQANPETQYGAMSSSLTSVKRADNGGFVRSQSSSYHDSDYKDYYYETSNLDKEPLLPSSVKKPKKRLSTQ